VRYFEDLVEGEESSSGSRRIETQELIDFAHQYDPQYFHADPDEASRSIFGGIIASGIFTMAIWRQLDHEIAKDIAWICGIAWDEVRFPTALRGGDEVRARARCVSKRISRSHPERGIVVYHYLLLNQRGETVFSCLSTNLVERRGSA
jgi:acyl dehydratase